MEAFAVEKKTLDQLRRLFPGEQPWDAKDPLERWPAALQFIEEEVVGRGVRCIFAKSGVDSADGKRWRMLLNYHAGIDEFVTSMYSDNIRVAQELGLPSGDWSNAG